MPLRLHFDKIWFKVKNITLLYLPYFEVKNITTKYVVQSENSPEQ